MTDLDRAICDFAKLFDNLRVPYAVMGGIAVRVYGIPRATYDVDFTVAIGRDRLLELFGAVTKLGYTVPEQYLSGWVDEVGQMPLVKFRLYLESRGVDIDVFLAETPFQQEVIRRRVLHDVGNSQVWLVTPEDLVLLKLLAYRPRDMADIGDILFTQGQLDEGYLRQWATELGVTPKLEKALNDEIQL